MTQAYCKNTCMKKRIKLCFDKYIFGMSDVRRTRKQTNTCM